MSKRNLDANAVSLDVLPTTPTTLEGKTSQMSAYLDDKWENTQNGMKDTGSPKRAPETSEDDVKDADLENPLAPTTQPLSDGDDWDNPQVRGRKTSQYTSGISDKSKKLLLKKVAKRLYNWAHDKKLFDKNQRGDALFQRDTIEQIVGVSYGRTDAQLDLAEKRERARSGDMTRPATWDFCLIFEVGDNDKVVEYESDDDECAEISAKEHYPSGKVNQRKDFLRKTFQVNRRIEDAGLTVAYHKDGQRKQRRTTKPGTKASTASDRSMKDDEEDNSEYIFCLVGCDEATLREWADKSDYDLLLDPVESINYGRFRKYALAQKTFLPDEMESELRSKSWKIWEDVYAEYFDGKEKLYCKYYRDESLEGTAELTGIEKTSLFSTKDRYRLVYEAMIQDAAIGGGQLPLQLLQSAVNHPLVSFFPLHQDNKLAWFRDNWLTEYSFGKLITIPVEEIRNYFGEPIGFYFEFLQHYILWLILPAFLGLVAFVTQVGLNEISFEAIGLFMLGLCIWTVAMTDFWKRKEQLRIIEWGQTKYADKEVRRPQFQGKWEISAITGMPNKVQDRFKYRSKLCASFWFITIYVIMVGTSMVLLMDYRVDQQRSNNGELDTFTSIWVGVVTAVMITIFDSIYYFLRLYLNERENHRTQNGYENSNILKSFIFRFTNTFLSLFFICFIQPAYYPDSFQVDGVRMTDTQINHEVLWSLRVQLSCLFLTALVQQNLLEMLYFPTVQYFMMRGKMKDPAFKRKWDNRNTYEKQRDLEPYPDTLEDMSELVIQFGYVTLFVLAFPLAPLIAIFANMVEARVDGWKLVSKCQRPIPLGSNGLGMWTQILEIFSVIAIITNVCIYAFRTDRVAAIFGKENDVGVKEISTDEKYIFVIASCGILLGLSWIIRALIPDIPESVKTHVERQRAIESVLIKNAAMDSDDEWADFDVHNANRMEDPSKQYLRSSEGDPRMKLAKIMPYKDWEKLNKSMNININDRMSTLEPFINKPAPSVVANQPVESV